MHIFVPLNCTDALTRRYLSTQSSLLHGVMQTKCSRAVLATTDVLKYSNWFSSINTSQGRQNADRSPHMLKRMRCTHYRAGELAPANPSMFNSCIEMGHSWNLKALLASGLITFSGTWGMALNLLLHVWSCCPNVKAASHANIAN